jgi:hypothetical protein
MNHPRSAALVEYGVLFLAKCDVWVGRLANAVGVHRETEQVSSMRPSWIIFAVFLGSRIEMWPSAYKSRTFTFTDVVNVNAVPAGL